MRQSLILIVIIFMTGCARINTHFISPGMTKIAIDKKLSKEKICWLPDTLVENHERTEYCLYQYRDETLFPFSKKKELYLKGHYTKKREYFVEFMDGKVVNQFWRSQYLFDL